MLHPCWGQWPPLCPGTHTADRALTRCAPWGPVWTGQVSSPFPTGFQLGCHLLQLIVLRYADEGLQLTFDDFLNCLVRLENASRECLVGLCLLGPGGGSLSSQFPPRSG